MKKPKASIRKNGQVIWDDAEWEQVARFWREANPDMTIETMNIRSFNEAAAKMPEGRRRSCVALTIIRPPLAKALAALAAKEQPPAPEPEQKQKRGTKVGTKVVRWTAIEKFTLAETIHSQNPHYGWPYKEHLAGLSVEDVMAAQRECFPSERRRKIFNVADVREQLKEPFAIIRQRLDEEKAAARLLELERLEREREEQAAATPASPPPVAVTPSVTEDPLTVKIAHALTPMVRILAEEFGKSFGSALMPMIENVVLNFLTSPSAPAVSPPASAEPPPMEGPAQDDPLEHQPPSSYHGPEGVVRPPRVAVIGPSMMVRELEAAFPDIEFTAIERAPKGVPEAVEHCAKILGIDKFVTEAAKKAIKSSDKGKSKFVPVHGGTSAAKRQVDIWLKSGQLA